MVLQLHRSTEKGAPQGHTDRPAESREWTSRGFFRSRHTLHTKCLNICLQADISPPRLNRQRSSFYSTQASRCATDCFALHLNFSVSLQWHDIFQTFWAVQTNGCSLGSHLGEKPPPLPVSQFQVSSTVPLEDFQGTQLLLFLRKGSKGKADKLTIHKKLVIWAIDEQHFDHLPRDNLLLLNASVCLEARC